MPAPRRSSQRARFEYEEAAHVALLELLKGLPGQGMVSGHPSALYTALLAGGRWRAVQVTPQAQVRTEVGWCNCAPDRVPWARSAGRHFTARRCLKRKAAHWGRRSEARPAGERRAVLAALKAGEAEAGS